MESSSLYSSNRQRLLEFTALTSKSGMIVACCALVLARLGPLDDVGDGDRGLPGGRPRRVEALLRPVRVVPLLGGRQHRLQQRLPGLGVSGKVDEVN